MRKILWGFRNFYLWCMLWLQNGIIYIHVTNAKWPMICISICLKFGNWHQTSMIFEEKWWTFNIKVLWRKIDYYIFRTKSECKKKSVQIFRGLTAWPQIEYVYSVCNNLINIPISAQCSAPKQTLNKLR